MKFILAVTVLGSVVFDYCDTKGLPSYIPQCRRSVPDFNMCMLKAADSVRPHIAKGIKELNIPAIEPLEIPMIKLQQGTGAVNYKASLTEIRIFGLSNYHFTSFMAEFTQKHRLHGKVDLPFIMLEANYVISGRALVVPIQGSGLFTANITNCKADVSIEAELIHKKGLEYLHAKDTSVKLQLGGAMTHFDNLFNGDSLLGDTTNNFLNNNAKDLVEEVKPAIEAVASMLVDDIVSKILRTQPYEKLFPK